MTVAESSPQRPARTNSRTAVPTSEGCTSGVGFVANAAATANAARPPTSAPNHRQRPPGKPIARNPATVPTNPTAAPTATGPAVIHTGTAGVASGSIGRLSLRGTRA